MNQENNNQNIRKKDLLKEIRMTDFALIETALYLDAYPKQQEALDYFRTLAKRLDTLIGAYRKQSGPLTIYDAAANGSWEWTAAPWPWEVSANV